MPAPNPSRESSALRPWDVETRPSAASIWNDGDRTAFDRWRVQAIVQRALDERVRRSLSGEIDLAVALTLADLTRAPDRRVLAQWLGYWSVPITEAVPSPCADVVYVLLPVLVGLMRADEMCSPARRPNGSASDTPASPAERARAVTAWIETAYNDNNHHKTAHLLDELLRRNWGAAEADATLHAVVTGFAAAARRVPAERWTASQVPAVLIGTIGWCLAHAPAGWEDSLGADVPQQLSAMFQGIGARHNVSALFSSYDEETGTIDTSPWEVYQDFQRRMERKMLAHSAPDTDARPPPVVRKM